MSSFFVFYDLYLVFIGFLVKLKIDRGDAMITYVMDQKRVYEEQLITCLRGHNLIYTGNLPFKDLYIYMIEKDDLKAALSLSMNWDWLSIKQVYYEEPKYLNQVIAYLWSYMKHEVVGIKFFTPILSRLNDMIDAGFKETGRLDNLGAFDRFFYAELRTLNKPYDSNYTYIFQEKPDGLYHDILMEEDQAFHQKHHIKDKEDSGLIVALENQSFIGGISYDIYENTIDINRLAVIDSYRKKGIGTSLMHMVEKEALKLGIDFLQLGTTTFQAKAFYERLGFHVCHTLKDYPKGFETYTMIKRLAS